MLDVVIQGGQILDGTGAQARQADVGILGDRIAMIGDLSNVSAVRTLNVASRFVAPGFIDMHTHTDETVFLNPQMESKIQQGVTTEVTGNCGDSAAPLYGAAYDTLRKSLQEYGNIPLSWHSMGEYLDRVKEMGISTNYVTLVGYGTLRASVMGYAMRSPSSEELTRIQQLLSQSLEEGAWGISTGLIYPPCSYAGMDELVAVSRVAAGHGGIYTSHIRNEGDRLLVAVEEALTIGKQAGIPVQLSHHKAAGKRNWGKVQQSLEQIEKARSEGVVACADQYPYIASSTGLSTVLPDWAHEGGRGPLVQRLQDRETRARIAEEVRSERPGWENPAVDSGWHNIVVVGAKSDRALQGQSVWQIAENKRLDPVETSFNLLVENEGDVQVVIFSMCEEDVQAVMKKDWVFVGSDSTARAPTGPLSEVRCHPRTYGTFPRLLGRYVRELRVVTWEQAIAKMTSGPARMLGLDRRGVLKEGNLADIVVFDPESIADTATFTDPHQFPRGIDYVFVNGTLTVDHGNHTGARAGQVLRKH